MLIGAIVAAWSNVEQILAIYYGELVGGTEIRDVPTGKSTQIALATFDQINSLTQRRAMLIKAAEMRGVGPSALKQFKAKLKRIQEAYTDCRIIAAHGRWGRSPQFPQGLVWMRSGGAIREAMVYHASDFENDLQRIGEASDELQSFYRLTILPVLEADTQALIQAIATATKDLQDGL